MSTPFFTLTRLGAICLISWLAWDNWTLRIERDDIAQLRASLAQCKPALETLQAKTQWASPQCPAVVQPHQAPTATPGVQPTYPHTDNSGPSKPRGNSQAIAIPPGTDLREALRIIQREQGKEEAGAAGVNPFGPNR